MATIIDKITVYNSVRKEILEQKNCQFQLLSIVLTFSTGILAWGVTKNEYAPMAIAPMLLNVLGMIIILDKAASIQRMVGYLQLMESVSSREDWMWEYHLNIFRGLSPEKETTEDKNKDPRSSRNKTESRKHKYIGNITFMCIVLNIMAISLYVWKSHAIEKSNIIDIITHTLTILINIIGAIIIYKKWHKLTKGHYTGNSIRKRWIKAINMN